MGPNPIGLVSLKANELGQTHTHREDLMETVEEDGHLQSRPRNKPTQGAKSPAD